MLTTSKPSGCQRVLAALQASRGQWIELPYGRYHCIIHSRVAEMRRRGHQIDCRRNGDRYEYRLVVG